MATTISGSAGVTFPAGGVGNPTSAVVGINDTQTLTNKTLTSPTLTSPTMTGAVVSSMASSVITSGTAVASTSGTAIDFTSIPSWVKRITVMLQGVSTNGTSQMQIQLGAGSVVTTGYTSSASYGTSAGQFASATTGFIAEPTGTAVAVNLHFGSFIFTLVSSNVWVSQGCISTNASGATIASAGQISLGGTLDRIRITTVNGTDTFDAGSINILYE